MTTTDILVPDLGDLEQAEVVEVLVKPGDSVLVEQTIMTLESDKALLEVPASAAGVVTHVRVQAGQQVSAGDVIVQLEGSAAVDEPTIPATATEEPEPEPEPELVKPATESASSDLLSVPNMTSVDIQVPDLGDLEQAEVVEVLIKPGDNVVAEQTIMTLESDKALLEVPASVAGVVAQVRVQAGQQVATGDVIAQLEGSAVADESEVSSEKPESDAQLHHSKLDDSKSSRAALTEPSTSTVSSSASAMNQQQPVLTTQDEPASSEVYAGPAVRRLANQLGVDLHQVTATGPRGRIVKQDVKAFVKQRMSSAPESSSAGVFANSTFPEIDFAQWGEVNAIAVNRIQKKTIEYLTRSWSQLPQVTQFESADITELEAFRKEQSARLKPSGVRLTLLAFLIKASARVLKKLPQFNASLSPDQRTLYQKQYVHIGIAVDTPNGLLVPVIRDVDTLSVLAIAEQVVALSNKAREGKLSPNDMKGGCFSISSLGGLGGTAFTPLVNWPEVAILGVSRSSFMPIWHAENQQFEPRLMLPLSLSYDHRVINGADAARFTTALTEELADLRLWVL